jgi:hypothetical protein
MDWKREIVIAHYVRQKMAEADKEHLWDHHFPEVSATESAVSEAERVLGFSLDPSYREFLKHADGWRAFYQAVDLFGTSDLIGGARHERAKALLDSLEDTRPECGFSRAELMPIAVSESDIDVFAISKPDSSRPGTVLWFAGGLIEKFPGFDEWFLSMVDYNRLDYRRLSGQLRSGEA